MTSRLPTLGRARWSASQALLALALLGALLRWLQGLHAAWYWDEGLFTELAQDLGRGQRPRVGALWEDGFFPLSATWMAPLSAAPFTRLAGLDALAGTRLWAALLGGLSVWLLGRLSTSLLGARLGLAAAAALAVAPPALRLGSLALYHALGTVFALAALAAWSADPDGVRTRRLALLCAGLALAACYWLWWLPVGLGLLGLARPRGSRGSWLAWSALLGAGPLLALLDLQVALGGPAAWTDFKALFHAASGGVDAAGLRSVLLGQPLAWLGLGGLLLLPRGWRWMAGLAALGLGSLLWQRGELSANAYALLPLLPLLLLGLVLVLDWGLRRGAAARGLALLAALAAFGRFDSRGMAALSLPPAEGRAIQAYLLQHSPPDSLVLGLAPLNWGLRPALRAADPSQAAAWQGLAAGYVPADLPGAAWAHGVALDGARYYVSTWVHQQALYLYPGQALAALQVEAEGWPLVAQGGRYGIYANPRFGPAADPSVRVLWYARAYRRAAADAEALGRTELAALARRREATGLADP